MSATTGSTGPAGGQPTGQPMGPRRGGEPWQENRALLALILGTIIALIGLLLLFLIWSPFTDDQDVGSGVIEPASTGGSGDDPAANNGTGTGSDTDQPPAGPTDQPVVVGSGEALRCPVMTDSIDRLYLAHFERLPDDAEFSRWSNRYRTGEETLESIAQQLADSSGFEQRYGRLDNPAFVERIYRNAIGVAPDPDDQDVWVRALDSGRSRGAFTVAITETQRAVEVSRTTTPMAGFLRQYPAGTHWYCGTGPQDDLPIKPLTEPTVYADYMFHNGGQVESPAGFRTVVGGGNHLTLSSGALPPGTTSYRWSGRFDGDGNYGSALDVEAGANTWWVVVFYPSPIGEGRLGWQIAS